MRQQRNGYYYPVKKHSHKKAIGHTVCTEGSKYLRKDKFYDVIEQSDTKFLIRFRSGSAYWFSKNRFTDLQLYIKK